MIHQPPYTVDVAVLRDFVQHSNAIEGYSIKEYPETSRLFQQHLYAAQHVVETGEWDPLRLHFLILDGTSMLPPDQIGVYRTGQVYVGRHTPPAAGRHLLAHMERWKAAVVAGPQSERDEIRRTWTWNIHHHFESIHPFWDTNGRTGRLILASLRMAYGLPWPLIRVGREQQAYYRQIESFQNSALWECSENPWFRNKKPEMGNP